MKKILLILWFLPFLLTGQTTYYVKNGGNNDDDGLSPATAWATLAKVNGTVLVPGDSVLFERGSTWQGESAAQINIAYSGSEGLPITYSAYGTGEKPIFDGRYAFSASWDDAGGNVWRTHFPLSTARGRMRLFVDKGAGLYEIEKVLYSEGVGEDQFSNNEDNDSLYIYSEADPDVYYSSIRRSSYKYFTTAYGLTDIDYITISDLDLRGFYMAVGISNCSNWIIENCDIGEGFSYQAIVVNSSGAGSISRNGIIRNNTFDTKNPYDTYWTAKENTSYYPSITFDGLKIYRGTKDWDIHDNTLKGWGHVHIYVITANTPTASIEGINIYNNYFTQDSSNYGRAFGIDVHPEDVEADNPIRIFNNVAKNMGIRSQISGGYVEVFNNIFNGVTGRNFDPNEGAECLAVQGYYAEAYQMKIYNNVFANANSYGLWLFDIRNYDEDIKENIFANNIFYKNRGRYATGQQLMIGQADNGLIRNNEFYNNLFYSEDTENVIRNGSDILTVAQFNALTTGNTYAHTTSGNLFGDPDFTDPLADDFTIDNTSPAYGAGYEPTLSSADAAGRLWKTPPSIGAYEWYTEVPPVDYTLYINISGGGTVEVEGVAYTTSLTFEDNTVVNLEALHVEGYTEFLGWTGDLTSLDAIETITMDSDKTITANFTVMPGSIILHDLGLNEIILF